MNAQRKVGLLDCSIVPGSGFMPYPERSRRVILHPSFFIVHFFTFHFLLFRFSLLQLIPPLPRHHSPHPAKRIIHITFVAGDQVDVYVGMKFPEFH